MTWDRQYQNGQGRFWPHEELVRFLGRTYGPMPDEKAKGQMALEIGCGVGGNVWAMAKWGFFVYGFDLSGEAIELARRRAAEEAIYRTVQYAQYQAPAPLRLPPGSVNLCVDVQTMQHVSDDDQEAIYRELHRVLVPGGFLFSVHWVGGQVAETVFPAHPELCRFDSEYPLAWSINESGFAIESYEILSKTYGNELAQWAVIAARKI